MGKLFNNAAGERIEVTGTSFLAGFAFTFGTVAVTFQHNNVTGTQCYQALLASGGNAFQWYMDGGSSMTWWNAGVGSDFSVTVSNNTPYTAVLTKATGTATPRLCLRNHTSASAPSFTNGSGTQANLGTVTNIIIGAEDTSGANRFRGDMFQIAWWPSWNMSDNEMARIATAPNFEIYGPDAYADFSYQWAAGDMMHTLGRWPIRQSTRVGATRGTVIDPPGYRPPMRVR